MRIDPLALVQTVERFLLMRGYGRMLPVMSCLACSAKLLTELYIVLALISLFFSLFLFLF